MLARKTWLVASCFAALGMTGACTHDLDALQKNAGGSGMGSGGASGTGIHGSSGMSGGGSGSGNAGSGNAGSGNAGSGTAGSAPDACTCDKPPTLFNGTVKPTTCCLGSRGTECGEKFGNSDTCYALNVPGAVDTTCPDLMKNNVAFPGCCRPDGQCGVVVDQLHLGCVVNDELPAALGGKRTARPCVPGCQTDADCKAFDDALICAEDTAGARYCARFCQRDKDCADLTGKVCAIQNNLTDNRVDTLCRKPFGPAKVGETCTDPADCEHGTCLPTMTAGQNECTELCGSDLDCTRTADSCVMGTILTPQKPPNQKTQTIRFCRAQ